MSTMPKYPVTVYNPNAVALSKVNYFTPITDFYTAPVSDVTKSLFQQSPVPSGGMRLKLNLQLFDSRNPTIRINELQQAIDNRGSGYFERLQNSRQYGYTPSEEYYANLRAGRSNTSSPINYNHTLNLEINSTTSRIVGGHATNGNVIVGEIVETYPSGVYDAHVYMRDPVNPNNLIPKSNNNGISTLIPNWWTDDRVKYEFLIVHIRIEFYIITKGL